MLKALFLLPLMLLAACETVPITGRQQVSLVSDDEITTMAAKEYRTFLRESDVITGTPEARMVSSVGRKIKTAVENYLQSQGMGNKLSGYRWEFALVESDEVNAFCMPGGKVAVYTGILPIAQNEAGLAVVMGHEVAHAIANHGAERMSQEMLTETAGELLSAALTDGDEDSLGNMAFQAAFGLGTEIGILLPYSRLHESEADRLGLIFMAMAGYDPHEAPKFWRRMAEESGNGDSSTDFLSTHPSDATRIKDLEAAMGEAMPYYRKATRH